VFLLSIPHRAKIYKLLSTIFSEPTDKCLMEIDRLLDELAKEHSTYIERLELGDLYISLNEEKDKLLEECDRLMGRVEGGDCSPYERSYVDKSDEILESLRALHSKISFQPEEEELDHITNLLNFGYHLLISVDIDESEKNMILQEFLRKHVLSWLNKFTHCLKNKTRSKFYKKASETLEKFLEVESEYLGIG